MLKVLNIQKRFGAVTALRDASLTLAPGEIRALLGANGSGKSTLAKILGGLVYKNEGQILLDDVSIDITSPKESRRSGIVVAYQDLSLIPQLSVAENIMLGQEPRKKNGLINNNVLRIKAMEYMEQLKIQVNPDTLVRDLEVSTQSLIEVAKALASNPRILVLDEVTASLHREEVKILFNLLNELKEKGLSILFISHRFEEIFSLCDAVTVLRSGNTVISKSITEVDESELVYYMTGKRPENITNKHCKTSTYKDDILVSLEDITIGSKVKGINIDIYSGEIIGIAGLQGQGQSEFLRGIYGAIPLSNGDITFNGNNTNLNSPNDSIHYGIGFISGDREREGVFSVRSVQENLSLGEIALKRIFSIVNPKAIQNKAKKMIDKLNVVAGSIEDEANTLSGGNQQKLLIGRWLMINPKLLILDDPTKGVDISARREIHQLLRDTTKNNTSIIISSSDNEELLEVADRIFVFYEGQIVAELCDDEKTEEQLVAAMLGVKDKEERV